MLLTICGTAESTSREDFAPGEMKTCQSVQRRVWVLVGSVRMLLGNQGSFKVYELNFWMFFREPHSVSKKSPSLFLEVSNHSFPNERQFPRYTWSVSRASLMRESDAQSQVSVTCRLLQCMEAL